MIDPTNMGKIPIGDQQNLDPLSLPYIQKMWLFYYGTVVYAALEDKGEGFIPWLWIQIAKNVHFPNLVKK